MCLLPSAYVTYQYTGAAACGRFWLHPQHYLFIAQEGTLCSQLLAAPRKSSLFLSLPLSLSRSLSLSLSFSFLLLCWSPELRAQRSEP